MSHNIDRSEGIFSFITGAVIQTVGMITMETFWVPFVLAFSGGFLGFIGKRFGEYLMMKIKRKFSSRKYKKA